MVPPVQPRKLAKVPFVELADGRLQGVVSSGSDLLWAARSQLGLLPLAELRWRCEELLANPLVVPAFPLYLSGFVQALEPAPSLAPFVVELISKAFARLPDPVLLPWLPRLITTLRDQAQELVPVLVREAGRTFPASLASVDAWVSPWSAAEAPSAGPAQPAAPAVTVAPPARPVAELLAAHPMAGDAVAALLAQASVRVPSEGRR